MTSRREFLKKASLIGGGLLFPFNSELGKIFGRKTQPPTSGLSAEEKEALIYMREEEKLAHDVYISMYKKWGLSIFDNISYSEQHHTDAVANLLSRYNISDPALPSAGVFTNQYLQEMYDGLILWGNQSISEAVKVGLTIEEVDILDLQKYLAVNNQTDIQQVFGNLLNGSYNHLRAFSSTFTRLTGEIYEPQYLTQDAYQAIIAGDGMGGGGGMGGCGGGGGGGGRGS